MIPGEAFLLPGDIELNIARPTRTLAVGLQGYSTLNNVYWNQIMAASLVVSVPVVAGFLLLQRYLVTGLTAGAVK